MTSELQGSNTIGENFNQLSKLVVLEANGAEELASLIRQIKAPIEVISIVTQGARFYAFINSNVKITKKPVKK